MHYQFTYHFQMQNAINLCHYSLSFIKNLAPAGLSQMTLTGADAFIHQDSQWLYLLHTSYYCIVLVL